MEENKNDNAVSENHEQKQDISSEQEERKKQIESLLNQLKEQASIEEIHQRTHIALFKVDSILKCDYKQFDRTTAIGFIRILEREYKINLNPWIVDYDAYCQEYGLFKKDEYDSNTFTDVNMQIDRYEKRTSVKWLNLSIGAIIIVCGIGYLLFNYYSDSLQENLFEKPENKNEAEALISEVNLSAADKNISIEQENNATQESLLTQAQNTDNNQTEANKKSDLEPEEIVFSVGENVTGRQLWLGMLHVKTKKRSQQIVTGRLSIKGGEPILFVTGHGRFGVNVNDANLSLQGNSPLYLYYNPGEGIRVVSDVEFKEINGGRGW